MSATSYRAHVTRMFRLLGDDADRAAAESGAVMRIETALAKAAMSLVDRRDPKNIHHKLTLAGFTKLAPSFDWKAYLAEVGAPPFVFIDVANPAFFSGLELPLKSVPPKDWKAYLRWYLVHGLVSVAPKALVDEDFASSASGSTARPRLRHAGSAALPRPTISSATLSVRHMSSGNSKRS